MASAGTTAAAAAAAATSRLYATLTNAVLNTHARWAMGGWAFFVAENVILSENRTALIGWLDGDEITYHALYGVGSTLATASILYSYYHLTRKVHSQLAKPAPSFVSVGRIGVAWTSLSVGCAMALQALPKMQVPVGVNSNNNGLSVRCPFDFSDRRRDNNAGETAQVQGLERITRHPGLWTLAFMGAGQALLSSPHPVALWWWGPMSVAAFGGWHQDSRFRRGLGGTMDPSYDSQTSNVPFLAMLTGRQGRVDEAFRELVTRDVKPLNAGIGVAVATLWMVVATKGRVRM